MHSKSGILDLYSLETVPGAVSYDANADESGYLIDPGRAAVVCLFRRGCA